MVVGCCLTCPHSPRYLGGIPKGFMSLPGNMLHVPEYFFRAPCVLRLIFVRLDGQCWYHCLCLGRHIGLPREPSRSGTERGSLLQV